MLERCSHVVESNITHKQTTNIDPTSIIFELRLTNHESLLFGDSSKIVHWKPDCGSRGTFDVLSTCVITLLLCIWTAVHLNVHPPGHTWRPIFKKIEWLLLALLGPEMVAYTA